MNVFENEQKKIALATIKMSKAGAGVMGGMSHQQAVQFLIKIGMSKVSLTKMLREHGHSWDDITEFMKEPT